jgi:lipopolysaccharide/colanic/teichoic acid biosynthesis glycosyltransferase
MGDLTMPSFDTLQSQRQPLLPEGMGAIRRPHVLDEQVFRSALVRERKRADRSNQPLILLLARLDGNRASTPDGVRAVVAALTAVKDPSHVAGWFEGGQSIGLIAPEIGGPIESFTQSLEWRLRGELESRLGSKAAEGVAITIHAHPHAKQRTADGLPPVDPLLTAEQPVTTYDRAKRLLDVMVSLTLLVILSPLLLVIAALVKLKSPGPVLFKQVRVGQGMKPFKMLKFRSMRVNADNAVHHQFVTSFIKAGQQAQEAGQNGMFKLAHDPRITPIGRILRKTSLDELPQLWNVLRGDMSLVGPRPPLGYEVDEYQAWHCRRVLEAKPGITGLWQVAGRSRTTFDEMVRLDLRYARARSLWTDVKILLATPAAVIVGKGAA